VPVRELTALRRTLEQVVLELTGPSADRVDRSVGADRTSVWRRNGLGRVSDTRGSRGSPRGDADPAARTDPGGGRGSGRPDEGPEDRASGGPDGGGPVSDPAAPTAHTDRRGRAGDVDPAARTDRADGGRP
jgi:hypothetical protein